MKKSRLLPAAMLLAVVFSPGFSQTVSAVPEPYTKDEFPQWARDLRRTEIITFGSLPFVALSVTMGYGIVRFAGGSAFPNPFAKSADNLTQDEQKQVLFISLGTSVLLGLTDLTINLIQRHQAAKKRTTVSGTITVTELEHAAPLPPPEEEAPPLPASAP
jgi:hypothetical protein